MGGGDHKEKKLVIMHLTQLSGSPSTTITDGPATRDPNGTHQDKQARWLILLIRALEDKNLRSEQAKGKINAG